MQFTIHNTHISYAYTFPDKNLLRIVCPTFAKYFPSFRNPFHHLILTPGAPIPQSLINFVSIFISERYVCIIIIILNDVIRASESQSVITLAFY